MSSQKPKTSESLGEYLKRLRATTGLSQTTVADMSQKKSEPMRFTSAWLSKVEADGYEKVGSDKLRTLASIYNIPTDWLLEKAGYEIEPSLNRDELDLLLQDEDVLALLGVVAQLKELGYQDDVRLLLTMAQRYLTAYKPGARAGDIFSDEKLSEHVENYMVRLGLVPA
jgi:transcriptional regulator with XRE-family HTH domain